MKSHKFKTKMSKLWILITVFCSFVLTIAYPTYAFFRANTERQVEPTLEIEVLFGRLREDLVSGEWGTEYNPYLIMTTEHLSNLSVLQNGAYSNYINENSVFQVSDENGDPIYVGGTSANQLFDMQSIGTEDFPFISKFRGITTTDPNKYIQNIPTGEVTDTSVIGNIRINPYPGQVDIGLFGNVGPDVEGDEIPESDYQGEISNILLYNVQISTNVVGVAPAGHNGYAKIGTKETNHIGILAGHVQFANLDRISVYYSETNGVAHVDAFNVSAGDTAKYTTSGGIIGYYKEVIVDGEIDNPITSDGTDQGVGSSAAGLGKGIVYAQDIWTFMEDNTSVGKPAPNTSYDLQDTFGDELYDSGNNSYFHVGVFTFAHSRQARGKDRIAKIWTAQNPNAWTISTENSNPYTQTTRDAGPATRYTATRITRSQINWTSSGGWWPTYSGSLLSPYNNNANYRYMLVYEDTSYTPAKHYALVRYGSTAIGIQIDPTNLVIPDGELKYFTFENLNTRTADITYPPYESGFSYRFEGPITMDFRQYNASSGVLQYAVYGDIIYGEINGETKIIEAPRPLRINAQSGATPTASFMATASTGSTPYVEGLRISPISNTDPNFNKFYILRTGSNSSGNNFSQWFMTYSAANGFSAVQASRPNANTTAFSLYAVRYTDNASNPSESPVATRNILEEYIPNGTTSTINTEENVLYYTGQYNSSVNTTRYSYELKEISSLGWVDNSNKAITKGDTALIMGDPTSYYYIRNSSGVERYFGVNTGIPSPIDGPDINVPEGSIGFTVSAKEPGSTETTATINVIVATDPSQGVEQLITVSRFGTGTTLVGDRQLISGFVLPPPPGSTIIGTKQIYLKTEAAGPTYPVYPNFNRLLVAYSFEVNIETVPITYFLEASRGTACFVYLSSDRVAANDNNPLHENDIVFPSLANIDYVFKTQTNFIATVGGTDYIPSLTVPYFGIRSNPDYDKNNPTLHDFFLVTAVIGFDFVYNIARLYDPSTDEKCFLYIHITANVNGSGYTAPINVQQLNTIQQNMNFNFTENSHLDSSTNLFVHSDRVYLNINGYLLEDWSVIE